jgi:LPS sulfotransferase NodH
MQPGCSYLICATPRCGSSLLCDALDNTGVAGHPDEWFWNELGNAEHWGLANYSYSDYLQAVFQHGSTPNGVFGAKVMWSYAAEIACRMRQIPRYTTLNLSDLFDTVFPNLHYIWITRRDTLRQAVSHWKAIQTDVWRTYEDEDRRPTRETVYDFDAIDHLVQEIREHNFAWDRYFTESGISPCTVVYEDFVDRCAATITDILDSLGIALPPDLRVSHRQLTRQADAQSEEWVQRYLAATR